MTGEREIGTATVVRASRDQAATRLGEETVLLSLANSIYYGLDEVGTVIWGLLSEPVTVGAIRDAIVRQYDVTEEVCERDLIALLNELLDHGLIEIVDTITGQPV